MAHAYILGSSWLAGMMLAVMLLGATVGCAARGDDRPDPSATTQPSQEPAYQAPPRPPVY